jgi:hypothetical protein
MTGTSGAPRSTILAAYSSWEALWTLLPDDVGSHRRGPRSTRALRDRRPGPERPVVPQRGRWRRRRGCSAASGSELPIASWDLSRPQRYGHRPATRHAERVHRHAPAPVRMGPPLVAGLVSWPRSVPRPQCAEGAHLPALRASSRSWWPRRPRDPRRLTCESLGWRWASGQGRSDRCCSGGRWLLVSGVRRLVLRVRPCRG